MMPETMEEDAPSRSMARTLLIVAVVALLIVLPLIAVAMSDHVPASKSLGGEVKPMPEGDLPFGLSSKATLEDLFVNPAESSPAEGVYALHWVPEPAPPFDGYAVSYFEGVGICFIRAIYEVGNNDAMGIETHSTMDRVAEALTHKYGEPTDLLDVCGGGGVVCEQRFWDDALKEGRRIYLYKWDKPKTGSPIRNISLQAMGMRTGTFIRLTYRLGDEQKCEAARTRLESRNL